MRTSLIDSWGDHSFFQKLHSEQDILNSFSSYYFSSQ